MIKFAGAFCTKIRVSQFYFLTLGQHPVSLQRAGSIILVPFFIIFALLLSLPPSRNSDPGSHSRLFSPPYPLRFVPYFHREKISAISLSLLVVTQIRGHVAGSSPPLPTTVRSLNFHREKTSVLSSLVD